MTAHADLGSATDLMQTLSRIEAEARRAREAITRGSMPKGTAALHRIEKDAEDAQRRAIARRDGLDFVRDAIPAP